MSDASDDFSAMREHQRDVKQGRRHDFHTRILPTLKKFTIKHPAIEIRKLSEYQYRVFNTVSLKYFDIWTTRAMKDMSGHVCGFGFRDEKLWREVHQLSYTGI